MRAEEAIRAMLDARFPGYGFYGEETGQQRCGGELWLVDPIDGTKSFVREYPMFSTQIALMRAGELVLGVSSRRRSTASSPGPSAAPAPASTAGRSGSAPSRARGRGALSTGNLQHARPGPQLGALRRSWSRASTASAATATSCTTTCSRAARSTRSSSRTSTSSTSPRSPSSCARRAAPSPIWPARRSGSPRRACSPATAPARAGAARALD